MDEADCYTLLDIDDYLQKENTHRVITLFRCVHIALHLMTEQLALLETMSPKEYQEIRLQLGNGSGQESPGFRCLLKMHPHIWHSFKSYYSVGCRELRLLEPKDLREFVPEFLQFRVTVIAIILLPCRN